MEGSGLTTGGFLLWAEDSNGEDQEVPQDTKASWSLRMVSKWLNIYSYSIYTAEEVARSMVVECFPCGFGKRIGRNRKKTSNVMWCRVLVEQIKTIIFTIPQITTDCINHSQMGGLLLCYLHCPQISRENCRDRPLIAPWLCWQQTLRMPGRAKDSARWDVGEP